MLVDPATLLPEHRKLLELDFMRLGAGSTVDRQYWLAQMQTAVEVAELAGTKRVREADTDIALVTLETDIVHQANLHKTKQSNPAKRARKVDM